MELNESFSISDVLPVDNNLILNRCEEYQNRVERSMSLRPARKKCGFTNKKKCGKCYRYYTSFRRHQMLDCTKTTQSENGPSTSVIEIEEEDSKPNPQSETKKNALLSYKKTSHKYVAKGRLKFEPRGKNRRQQMLECSKSSENHPSALANEGEENTKSITKRKTLLSHKKPSKKKSYSILLSCPYCPLRYRYAFYLRDHISAEHSQVFSKWHSKYYKGLAR